MSVSAPFSPCGNTAVISATTTATTPVQVSSNTLEVINTVLLIAVL